MLLFVWRFFRNFIFQRFLIIKKHNKIKRHINQAGSTVPVDIYVNSDDDWNEVGFNEFKIEIVYNGDAMKYNGEFEAGNVFDNTWTINVTETVLN